MIDQSKEAPEALESARHSQVRLAVGRWRRAVVEPRIQIARLLPAGGLRLITVVVVTNVALGLLPVGFILAMGILVGRAPAAAHDGPDSPAFAGLVRAFLLAAGCFLTQQVLAPFQAALNERMKRRVDGELRGRILGVVMQSTGIGPLEDNDTLNAVSEATRLFENGSNTPGMACSGLLALIARYLRLLALLAIIAEVASWPAALAVGAATMMFRYGQRGGLRKYSELWREVSGINRRSQYLRELSTGAAAAKEIRIFGLVEWLSERYARSFLAAYNPVNERRRQIYLLPYLLFTLIGLLIAGVVSIVLAQKAAAGDISLAELAIASQALTLALLLGEFYPESDVATQFGMQAVAALEEARERIQHIDGPVPTPVRSVAPDLPSRSLKFDRVSFRYPTAGRLVLRDLELELPIGKSTAVVGMNGAGKTTLVKLLTRLYEPTSGAIRADGVAISELSPAAWRKQVSVIFQDFVRYELSAADNIALGAAHGKPDHGAIARAAEQAGILAAFDGHPLGLDTPLSRAYEAGIDLSGGQWQRIAIARSLYALRAGARILILDEPTSALDVRAEVAFFDRFMDLTHGATSLLISHRFSSVRRADRIVVIDGGGVIEQGSHKELMAADGHYARLFRLQAQRFAKGLDAEGARTALADEKPVEDRWRLQSP
jgi:ATP-binding cassette subfamily B protein